MKKLLVIAGIGMFVFSIGASAVNKYENLPDEKKFPSLLPERSKNTNLAERYMDSVYSRIDLAKTGLKKDVFYKAFKGYQHLINAGKITKSELLTIVDYSQSSHNRRLYIMNLRTGRLLYNTYVSHGKNSGAEYATSFSNSMNSNKSSLGFMVTGRTYVGRAGYSLKLIGMEPRYNSNVYNRGVVMHGSAYVNEARADDGINMGRSWGCPSVPQALSREIINLLQGGSCLFVYANDNGYTRSSDIVNAEVSWAGLSDMIQKQNAKLPTPTPIKDNVTTKVQLSKLN